ncbi:cysteine desulfurase family protein [Anaerosporobacter sp.]|uniref:cysteine desulfurase family protein n=1 Tax=Anaerosporobacter sp. TaxID=1872529 RepID=UPI00286FA8E6|nr:cysteine desulfurase family protein [Anaerosporobacter sp.]
MIYLDYAANTPTDERVLQEFCLVNQEYFGNPNSLHPLGVAAKDKLDSITARIVKELELKEREIVYTSGASESNNTAIKGIARSSRHMGKHILTSGLEHSSVSGTLLYLREQGYEVESLAICNDGTIDRDSLRELLRNDTVLVTVCAVDSELGIVQPIEEIASIVKEFPNCRLHIDATQAIGKVKFDFNLGDTISFAPHKFYGLNGCGVLIKKSDLIMEPLIHGGASTTIYRSGTPAVAMAASIWKAIKLTYDEFTNREQVVKENNIYLRERLRKSGYVIINSPIESVPHILNISILGIRGYEMQERLAKQGICLSAKSACSTKTTPSKPVLAVTKDKKRAMSSFRISMSHITTKEEIDIFLEILNGCR